MKLIFLSVAELNALVNELLKGTTTKSYKIGFSEQLERDVVEVYHSLELQEVFLFETVMPKLKEHFNLPFHKYDVIEIDDFGVGFAFFF